jgi:hypothetical protein
MVWRQLGIPRRYGIHTLVYYQQCESMESAITNRPRPSFPRKRESSIPRLFWILSLRGNDGYFDRLVLKKARVVHESMA